MVDAIIIAVVLGVVIWSVAVAIKNKKQGKSACGCDCSKCTCCSFEKSDKDQESIK